MNNFQYDRTQPKNRGCKNPEYSNTPFVTHPSFFCSIYEKIGRGMDSEVFKGRKKQTIEYYAIKSVALSQKRRVHQEVRS